MQLTQELARRAAMDAADRQMSAAGRTAWNEEDAELAAQTFYELWPPCRDGFSNVYTDPKE